MIKMKGKIFNAQEVQALLNGSKRFLIVLFLIFLP